MLKLRLELNDKSADFQVQKIFNVNFQKYKHD